MLDRIHKRDGTVVPFDLTKIAVAIRKALAAVGEDDPPVAEWLAGSVRQKLLARFRADEIPTVEHIQDVVEETLIEAGRAMVAKAYILYRQRHADLRDTGQMLDESVLAIDRYLDGRDWRIQENANIGYSLQGLNLNVSAAAAARYWLERVYSREVAEAHRAGDLHLHDLGQLSVYCCGWDLYDLLVRGFGGVEAKVESRPPRHFRSALGQVVNFFYTLQGEAAGAQALANVDTLLAPFIRYDDLDYDGVKQAVQEFVFNMNVPTRVGFQAPFTNLTLDVRCPPELADTAAIRGGEPTGDTLGDFDRERELFHRALGEVLLGGDARGRPFTFPIPTYNLVPGFDWEHPSLDVMWEMTARYGLPYFGNFIGSGMDPSQVRAMCCHLRLDTSRIEERLGRPGGRGGLFAAHPLTGSVGVVTLNCPRLGLRAEGRRSRFLELLDEQLVLACEALEAKRKLLERLTEQGLYPYSRVYLKELREGTGLYWHNHFSTIGVVGVNEACLNLFGQDIGTEVGREFASALLERIRERVEHFSAETGNLYNLEATPAESTAYRLARLDRERYGDRAHAAGGREPYYTNSTHLPVGYTDDLFIALEHQEPLQELYTGGTVFHAFLGEPIEDARQCRLLVRRMAERTRLPYFTITPTYSICPIHGYIAGLHETCPIMVEEPR